MVDDMRAAGYLSVAEAARRLGVTRQRVWKMIDAGDLPAERAGRGYLVRPEDVERRLSIRVADGRRFTMAHAWGLIWIAAGRPTPWLDPATRWRLGRILAARGFRALSPRLTGRAERSRLRAHPSELSRLRSDSRLVLTGAVAASELRLGLFAGDNIEAYVDAEDVGAVRREYHLQPSRDPNVILRVVRSFGGTWGAERRAPLPAVALDLLDDDDPRAVALGERILKEIG